MAKKKPARQKTDTDRPAKSERNKVVRLHETLSTEIPEPEKRSPPLVPRNDAQKRFLQAINSMSLIFALGPAGTGKTYVAAKRACQLLDDRRIAKIIITRPAVEAEENLGFLPGEIEDKFAPYFKPLRTVFEHHFGRSRVEYMIKRGQIEIAPLAYLRGETFEDAFVILDEAQNTTIKQMKLFLSRIGPNCNVVVDGDVEQKDINVMSGLEDALLRFHGMGDTAIVKFEEKDIVRSPLCKEIITRYRLALDQIPRLDVTADAA